MLSLALSLYLQHLGPRYMSRLVCVSYTTPYIFASHFSFFAGVVGLVSTYLSCVLHLVCQYRGTADPIPRSALLSHLPTPEPPRPATLAPTVPPLDCFVMQQ